MKLHELKNNPGATSSKKRVGRGVGSGKGKTATKGHKGQHARGRGKVRIGFEGGQTPIYRRLPKKGFTNALHKINYVTINVEDLEIFNNGDVINLEFLKANKTIKTKETRLKVLSMGELTKKLTVQAHKFSKEAALKIEQAGGKAEVI